MDFNMRCCPTCGSTNTFRRTGVHFDHERFCSKCMESYDPEEELEKYNLLEKERLEYNTSKE